MQNKENDSDVDENVSFSLPIPPATPPRKASTTVFSTLSSGYVSNTSQYALIDHSGICSNCNDACAMKTSLTCLLCSQKFHAVCTNVDGDKSGNEVICARTFYGSFMKASTGVYSQRPGNFVFICDCCMTTFEHDKTVKSEDKIDKVESRVNDLSQNVDEIKSILLNLTSQNGQSLSDSVNKSHISTTDVPVPSDYRDALVKPTKTRSVLIVEGDNSVGCNIDDIIIENGIHVEKTVKKNSGNSVFVCPTQEDRDNLNQKLSEVYPEIKTRQPPDLLPTISVANLSVSYGENQLKEVIFKEHRDIKFMVEQGEKFEILAVKPQKKDNMKFQATIRIGNSIRKMIKNLGDRLYIGSNSNPVYDTFHVKRCNKCQKFNHYHSDCKSENVTCGYCSKNHESKNCPIKASPNFIPKCTNCSSNNRSEIDNHSSFDLTCPSYKSEQEKRRRMISFYNQKN